MTTLRAALRLADALMEPVVLDKHAMQAAAELRRLHVLNGGLVTALNAMLENAQDYTALLRQALEALEKMLDDAKHERVTVMNWNGCVEAITALRERLGEKK